MWSKMWKMCPGNIYWHGLSMCFVVVVQMIISIESFAANLTREPIVSSVDRRVTIFVLKLGKRLWAIVAFISNTCMFIHVEFVAAPLTEAFLAHFAVILLTLIFAIVEPLVLVFSADL